MELYLTIAVGFVLLFGAYLYLNREISGHVAHIVLLFLYISAFTCYLIIIKDMDSNNVPLKNSKISIKAKLDLDTYSSYRVIETDSTITLRLYSKNDSLIYIK